MLTNPKIAVMLVMTSILGIGWVPLNSAQAAELQLTVDASNDHANFTLASVKTFTIDYEPSGTFAQELDDANSRIQFSDSDSADVDNIKEMLNEKIAEKNSQARIEDLGISYTAVLKGSAENALMSYKVELAGTIRNIILAHDSKGTTVVDASWRDIVIDGPLFVTPQEFTTTPSDLQLGEIDVNCPIGLLQITHPNVADKIRSNVDAANIFQSPFLDFRDLGIELERWHTLEDGGRSFFSLGEASLREGLISGHEESKLTSIDGSPVRFSSSIPLPSAFIEVDALDVVVVPEFALAMMSLVAAIVISLVVTRIVLKGSFIHRV